MRRLLIRHLASFLPRMSDWLRGLHHSM